MSKIYYERGGLRVKKRGAVFFISGTVEGKLYRLSARTKTLAVAKNKLHAMLAEIESGWRNVSEDVDWHRIATMTHKRHRFGAQKRGMIYSLTAGDVYAMMAENDFTCAVSGIPFTPKLSEETTATPWAPSIDRITNEQGYIAGNVRVVCLLANLGMNRFGYDALLRLSHGVVRSARPVPESAQNVTQYTENRAK